MAKFHESPFYQYRYEPTTPRRNGTHEDRTLAKTFRGEHPGGWSGRRAGLGQDRRRCGRSSRCRGPCRRRRGRRPGPWPRRGPGGAGGCAASSPSSQAAQGCTSPWARSWTRQSRGSARRRAAGPDRADGGDLGDVEALGGADGHRPGHRLDVQHVAGPAVVGGRADAQAPALADGEGVGAVVLAEDGAGLVDDLAGGLAEVPGQEPLGVAVGDEADVVAVRLVGHRQPAAGGLGADLVLRRVAEREHGVAELSRR